MNFSKSDNYSISEGLIPRSLLRNESGICFFGSEIS